MTDQPAIASPGIDDFIPLPTDLSTLPKPDPWYQVVGQRRNYIVKRTMFGQVMLELGDIDYLPDSPSVIWKDIPKIPVELLNQAWSFFRWAFATRDSEAMVYLLWLDDAYQLFVPTQQAAGLGVHARFDPTGVPAGAKICGSIHSHCNIGAFHSMTDEGDADDHDGIHITIGYVDRDQPDLAAMLSFSAKSWDLKPEEYFDGTLVPGPFPAAWKDKMVGGQPTRKWKAQDPKATTNPVTGAPKRGLIPFGRDIDDYSDAWWLKTKQVGNTTPPGNTGYKKTGGFMTSIDYLLENPDHKASGDDLAEAAAIDDELDVLVTRAAVLGLDLDVRIYKAIGWRND